MPELAQKIKMFFALAPAVIIKHAKSPIMKMSFLLDRQFKIFQVWDWSLLYSPELNFSDSEKQIQCFQPTREVE